MDFRQPRHILAYLLVEWRIATGRKNTKTSRLLSLIATETFEPKEPGRGTHGFSSARQAIWATREQVRNWGRQPAVSLKRADHLFDTTGYIERTLREFRSETRCQHWRARQLDAQSFLRSSDAALLKTLHVQERDLQFHGLAIVAADEGVIWISITSDETALTESAATRAAVISARVSTYRTPDPARWTVIVRQTKDAIAESADTFGRFCRDLIRTTFREPLSNFDDADVYRDSDTGERRTFVYLQALAVDLSRALRELLATHAARADREHSLLVVCTNVAEAGVVVTTRELLDEFDFPGLRIEVLGIHGLWGLLGMVPWVWSRHFARGTDLRVVGPGDDAGLQKQLLCSPSFAKMPYISAAARDFGFDTTADRHIVFVGRPGAGKTTAIYSLLRTHFSDRPTVVIPPGVDAGELLVALLELFRRSLFPRTVIVVDDLHYDLSGSLSHTRLHRASLASSHDAVVIVAGLQRSYFATEGAATLLADARARVVDVDVADEESVTALVAGCIRQRKVQMPESYVSSHARQFLRRNTTPRDIVATLFAVQTHQLYYQLTIPGSDEAQAYWSVRFRNVRQPLHRVLLQAAALLRLGGCGPLPEDEVRAVTGTYGWADLSGIDVALDELVDDGWLRREGPNLYADDAQIALTVVELATVHGTPTRAMDAWVRGITRSGYDESGELREKVMTSLGVAYFVSDPPNVRVMLNAIDRCLSANASAQVWQRVIQTGNFTAAQRALERYHSKISSASLADCLFRHSQWLALAGADSEVDAFRLIVTERIQSGIAVTTALMELCCRLTRPRYEEMVGRMRSWVVEHCDLMTALATCEDLAERGSFGGAEAIIELAATLAPNEHVLAKISQVKRVLWNFSGTICPMDGPKPHAKNEIVWQIRELLGCVPAMLARGSERIE